MYSNAYTATQCPCFMGDPKHRVAQLRKVGTTVAQGSYSTDSVERTRSHVYADENATSRVLVFWDGGHVQRPLGAGMTLVIGRAEDCTIRVDHPSVSRRHLAVHGGPPISVEDLGSANGTRVAGTVIRKGQNAIIVPGVVVEAGGAMIVVETLRTESVAPSGAMEDLKRLVGLVATSGLSVLLLGETGSGKDVTAQKLHQSSARAKGPFVRLNCAALPEPLLESELFGHERGAFTGAVKTKSGLLETASGGTVFLDELGEMPLTTQAKLLRALENREIMRVGGTEPRPIDVRFIAATNRDLPALVAEGSFRGDLYFRLNGITLRIPPLRERRNEIPDLARRFAGTVPILPDAMSILERQPWPGNVRELRNVVERAVVLSQGQPVQAMHVVVDSFQSTMPAIPAAMRPSAPPTRSEDLRKDVDTYERDRIVAALEQAKGNQTEAAEILGISRRTLVSRLDAYALPRPRKKD